MVRTISAGRSLPRPCRPSQAIGNLTYRPVCVQIPSGMSTATAPEPTTAAPAPHQGIPPGPRMSRTVQTAIWLRKAQWLLEQSRNRFGETFTLNVAHEGTWVILSNPEDVRKVFTGDPNLLHAGEANRILLLIVGDHSVLLLDGKAHMEQRKLML